jgi:hypothetical protein
MPRQGGTTTYTGYGSKDIEKMGGADAYRPGGAYDPYKKESIFDSKSKEADTKTEKKKKKKKKKKDSSSDEENSSDDDSDEDDEEVEKPKRFKKKKGNAGVITKPPKKDKEAAHKESL